MVGDLAKGMKKADYIRRAEEARRLALSAKTQAARAVLLKLANLWDRLARRMPVQGRPLLRS